MKRRKEGKTEKKRGDNRKIQRKNKKTKRTGMKGKNNCIKKNTNRKIAKITKLIMPERKGKNKTTITGIQKKQKIKDTKKTRGNFTNQQKLRNKMAK